MAKVKKKRNMLSLKSSVDSVVPFRISRMTMIYDTASEPLQDCHMPSSWKDSTPPPSSTHQPTNFRHHHPTYA